MNNELFASLPAGLTKNQFYKQYDGKKGKGGIITGSVFRYIAAALYALYGVLVATIPAETLEQYGFATSGGTAVSAFVSAAIALLLGLGIARRKSRLCAWLSLFVNLLGGIFAIVGTTRFKKLWKQYKKYSKEAANVAAAAPAVAVAAAAAAPAVEAAAAAETVAVEEPAAEAVEEAAPAVEEAAAEAVEEAAPAVEEAAAEAVEEAAPAVEEAAAEAVEEAAPAVEEAAAEVAETVAAE